MAGFELKPGQGSLHITKDKQGNEARPDRWGELNIDGTIYRLSGWIKQGPSGPWLSLVAETPKPAEKPSVAKYAESSDAQDREIPFR